MEKKLRNYFMISDMPRLIGVGMMILGAILLLAAWFVPIGWFFWVLMCVCLAGGPVVFWVTSSMRASEGEIDELIKRHTDDMGLTPDEESKYRKRLLDTAPKELHSYVYREGLMLTNTKSGTVRSEEFAKALLYLLSDGILIIARTVSLITEQKQEQTWEIPFALLEKAELVSAKKQVSFGKKTFEVTETLLQITYDATTLSLPTQRDFELEQFVEELPRLAAEHQN